MPPQQPPQNAPGAENAPAKDSKLKMLIIVAALLVAGAVAYYFLADLVMAPAETTFNDDSALIGVELEAELPAPPPAPPAPPSPEE